MIGRVLMSMFGCQRLCCSCVSVPDFSRRLLLASVIMEHAFDQSACVTMTCCLDVSVCVCRCVLLYVCVCVFIIIVIVNVFVRRRSEMTDFIYSSREMLLMFKGMKRVR